MQLYGIVLESAHPRGGMNPVAIEVDWMSFAKKGWLAVLSVVVAAGAVLVLDGRPSAMQLDGCGAGACKDCHSLTPEEAGTLLEGLVDRVRAVRFSEVGGLWEIDAEKGGSHFPLYIDYSKQFVLSGRVIRISTREDMTRRRVMEMNTVDRSKIPLEDALVLGSPSASRKVIVFDDPECPYCIKLHAEMKKVVEKNPDVAFYIKMFPLVKIHPKSYDKARAIVCEKSMELLEASFAGKDLPPPGCDTRIVDENIRLAGEIGVRSTPTLILPNGLVLPGFKKAEDILKLIEATAER